VTISRPTTSALVEGIGCDVPADVVARLRTVRALAQGPLRVGELSGGLTNLNYKVTTADGRSYVARLSSPDGELLAIDRAAEHLSSVAAASTGIAPGVIGFAPRAQLLVIAWVDGRTLTAADLQEEEMLRRVAGSVLRLHSGPAFPRPFDMFDIQQRYLAVVRERGFRLPPRYLEFADDVGRIQAAVAVKAGPTVPCNNDLLAANLIDDGDQIWLIDYEYAGNNDPCFELGNIWSEAGLEPELLDVLVDAYFGTHLRHQVARARLLGLMAKYGWMLWASIQHGVSRLDFDFWTWGMAKYERAVAEFDGPRFEKLLAEAVRDD